MSIKDAIDFMSIPSSQLNTSTCLPKSPPRAWSSMIVKRMEDLNNINFRADGFPEELVDNEVEQKGYEL